MDSKTGNKPIAVANLKNECGFFQINIDQNRMMILFKVNFEYIVSNIKSFGILI